MNFCLQMNVSNTPPNGEGGGKSSEVVLNYEMEVDGVKKKIEITSSFKSFVATASDYVKNVLRSKRAEAPRRRPCIIGVVGGAGCGKSTFCEIMTRELNATQTPSVTIGMDAYHYRNEYLESHYINSDSKQTLKSIKGALETIDAKSIRNDLSRFCVGQEKVEAPAALEGNADGGVFLFPAYDRNLHNPVPGRVKVDIAQHQIVFFEGLHLLANDARGDWAALRNLFDGLIVLKVPIEECKRRVIARKVLGGRSEADALAHWNRSDLKIHENIKDQVIIVLKSAAKGSILLYDG